MKRTFIIKISAALVMMALVVGPQYIYTNTDSPPPGHTGAPGENTCNMSGCHTGSAVIYDPNTLKLQTLFSPFIDNGYTPGTTYSLMVNFQTNTNRHGFQITALDSNDDRTGIFALIDVSKTSLKPLNNREYVGHKNESGAAWTFQWEADSNYAGPVNFYITGNSANNNLQNTGDQIYRAQFVATTSSFAAVNTTGIAINADVSPDVSIFPNPFADALRVSYVLRKQALVKLELFDNAGKKVFVKEHEVQQGHQQEVLQFSNSLPRGIYILKLTAGADVYFKKLMAE